LREGSGTSPSDKLREIDRITLDDVVSFSKSWKNKLYLETYLTGNMSE
jgi:secreted Zn-dependent insulinase-like peptidase